MNLAAIPAFASDDIFHVVVEVPRGSTLKLKYEPQWDAMTVSRPLPLGVTYPFDWGFVPLDAGRRRRSTRRDAAVGRSLVPERCRPVPCDWCAARRAEPGKPQSGGRAFATIASCRCRSRHVASRASRISASLPARVRQELEQFAVAATALEGKDVRVVGWGDASAALKLPTRQCDAMRCEDEQPP